MKLLIVGSRNITNYDLSPHISSQTSLIISGGAHGIDTLAEQYADQHRISKLILRPDYSHYKKVAPIKRNQQMVDLADEVLVIWDGKSKGTLHTIEYAKKAQKVINVIISRQDTE